MSMHVMPYMMRTKYLVSLGILLMSACSGISPNNMRIGSGYSSNGERIYFTAKNEDGNRISVAGGDSQGGMMMRSQLTCASCHGEDGRGGDHFMYMTLMDAPDIRFSALINESSEHNYDRGEVDEHAAEHASYGIEAFRRAVIYGEHPNGNLLDADMPRWKMSDDDLFDLFTYIKSLD